MGGVVVLGDLVTDVAVQTAGPVAVGSDTEADVTVRGGGSAANTACWLASVGVVTALVARVGNDAAGRARVQEIVDAGVTPVVSIDGRERTGTVVVLVGADGERTMLTDRGASRRLHAADLPATVLREAVHLHLSGYVLFDAGSRPAALEAKHRAREGGLTVSVDAASAAPLTRVGARAFQRWTAGADLLLANVDEARVLTGCPDPVEAATRLAGCYDVAIVKAGAEGAVWAAGNRLWRCTAVPARVRDTTGAGDGFAAGLLAAWLTGAGPAESLAAGAALAAVAVSIPGGRPGGTS